MVGLVEIIWNPLIFKSELALIVIRELAHNPVPSIIQLSILLPINVKSTLTTSASLYLPFATIIVSPSTQILIHF